MSNNIEINSRTSNLKAQFYLLQAIRDFFNSAGFQDVLTPPMVDNPGMEVHIHPFELFSLKDQLRLKKFLHTSPEFHMKELLSLGLEKIFTLSYCFRDEPSSDTHRNQFLMLEWYRANARYESIMEDSENLIKYSINYLREKSVDTDSDLINTNFQRATIQGLFQEMQGIDILNFLDRDDLKRLIEKDFKDIPLPKDQTLEWDDYYFLLFLNKIEPELSKIPYILLYEFPHHLSALSTLKEKDDRVCERFEIYIKGIELCNCFNELRDINIQKRRFTEQALLKKDLYGYELPEPKVLYDSLELGFPESAGIALGVERLLMGLTKKQRGFWG